MTEAQLKTLRFACEFDSDSIIELILSTWDEEVYLKIFENETKRTRRA